MCRHSIQHLQLNSRLVVSINHHHMNEPDGTSIPVMPLNYYSHNSHLNTVA